MAKKPKTTRLILTVVCLVVALVWGVAWAETLYVQRTKVDVRQGKGSFYPKVYTAKMGEALQVLGREGGWYKVQTPGGAGYVFEQALEAKKPSTTASFAGTANTSELDQTAGYKGFDAPTEQAYVSANNLQAQMRLVDRIERIPFSVRELESFQERGQVGPMGGAR